MLNNVIYFAANDAIHGFELWRSDGTNAGTYMLKDILPGSESSSPSDITAVNDKIYFTAYTYDYGYQLGVSDGTENGTELLTTGASSNYPLEFVAFHSQVYFVAGYNQDNLWKTDGTAAGTKEVADIGQGGSIGYAITQLTAANKLLFFTFYNFNTQGWQLWRSDGTADGTYNVATRAYFPYAPTQLTKYGNALYFSADDGTGRKLWVSDGTDAGTTQATNNHDVLIDADYFGTKFPVFNNVLYMPGSLSGKSDALYKYDASNNDGLVKVKSVSPTTHTAVIIPSEMTVVHNSLYFKVTDNGANTHDELWSSDGSSAHTQLITKFFNGETISNLYDGTGTLYFVKYDKILGAELWKLVNTFFGSFPIPESDVFKGPTGSYPAFFTAFNDKLFFSATDDKKGNELFMTNSIGIGASIVKDINTTSTSSSDAGAPNYAFITPFGNGVVFSAYENIHGDELYKSDGTNAGTILLNDIIPWEPGGFPQNFLAKNNHVYFSAYTSDTTSAIFKTNGTKSGLQKLTIDFSLYNYSLRDFKIADNGNVFYAIFNFNSGDYQLWRSNGNASGTVMLSSSVYSNDYLNVVNNTAFFVAGDDTHGYELWKSDGTVAGTKMVKDINPGLNDSYPAGMVVFNNEVYFTANDGTSSNGGTGIGFWKSDESRHY